MKNQGVTLKFHNGTSRTNYAILPSAFAYFKKQTDGYIIRGGGNGHGAGMSQYGVLGMLTKGYNYYEILQHYYPDSEIKKIY